MEKDLLWYLGQGRGRGWSSLTDHSGLQIHKHHPGHMFSSPSFTKEGVEGVIPSPDCLVAGHLPIWLDPMFQAAELPAGIASLHSIQPAPRGLRYTHAEWTKGREKRIMPGHDSCLPSLSGSLAESKSSWTLLSVPRVPWVGGSGGGQNPQGKQKM